MGYDFLYPGCGYGGSCFPKDVKALIRIGKAHQYDLKVLNAVEEANNKQKHVLTEKIRKHFGSDLAGKHFALWGLAFKPNTDDMREAASRVVIQDLLKAGATVCAYDPVAMAEAKRIFKETKGLSFAISQNQSLDNADALVIVTEWKEFRSPDFSLIKQNVKEKVIFDGRNMYEPKVVKNAGIQYYPVGRLTD
ncbi:MAG: hypothetical protein CTY12_03130 [Methylotenera sp.]|nr:MAG: hypothetical protein CTY12_03130 [Methylotenera sp.]